MTYRTKFTDGPMTVGETRATVGMMTGAANPDDVIAFVIVAFNLNQGEQDLVIVSDRGHDRRQIDAILYLAHCSTMAQVLEGSEQDHSNVSRFWDTVARFGRFYNLWKGSGMA